MDRNEGKKIGEPDEEGRNWTGTRSHYEVL